MLRVAKVVAVHPEGNAVDIVYLDDGSTVPFVQVMAPMASTNTGLADLAVPTPSATPWDPRATNNRDMYAIVGFVARTPVVLGFLFPQVCQLLFTDMNRRVDRHASDVYTSIDDAGNVEVYHPSGTYLRIGTSAAHEDLTGKDFDKKWKIARNTDKAVHVHLSVSNAGSQVASIDIDPSGNIVEQNNGNLNATVGGNLEADVTGTTKVISGGAMTLKAPSVTIDSPQTTCTGKLTVEGLLTYLAGLQGSGGGTTAAITGNVTVTSGNVTADGIGLKTHTHSDPQGGSVGPPTG